MIQNCSILPSIYIEYLNCKPLNQHGHVTGNCVQLDGTGDLNHYSCKENFINGCPTMPYSDDIIYECT